MLVLDHVSSSPEEYARDLIDQMGINIDSDRIDPFKIGSTLGIKYYFENIKSCEAIFILKNGQKRVIFKDNSTMDPRINFTMAHELGHYYISWIIKHCDRKLEEYYNSFKYKIPKSIRNMLITYSWDYNDRMCQNDCG